MTSRVVTVTADTPVLTAATLMLQHKVSGLPVIDGAHHVVGIVSEHDLLRRHKPEGGEERLHWLALMTEEPGLAPEAARFRDEKVGSVMTRNVVTVTPETPLEQACHLIEDRGIKRLPVVHDGKLTGIIARADLVRALARSIARPRARPMTDESVRARLVELEQQNWRNRARSTKTF